MSILINTVQPRSYISPEAGNKAPGYYKKCEDGVRIVLVKHSSPDLFLFNCS